MSATVERRSVKPRRYLAWCNSCQDGYNAGSKPVADRWATAHNAEHHGGAE